MSETYDEPQVEASAVTKVARNLTAILELAASLEDQAIAKANDPLMPGGLAMVALAQVANLDEWAELLEAAEHRHLTDPKRWTEPAIEDTDDWEPPLQTLRYWSEGWRTTHGMTYGTNITLASEANFIRWALNWAWDNEAHWDDFAADIRMVRRRMENLLKSGTRDIISDDVTCLICETRLRRRMTSSGYEDEWWCVDCHNHLTPVQFNLASSNAGLKKVAQDLGLAGDSIS